MSKEKFLKERFNETPVIGILRGYPMEVMEDLIPVYMESGFHTLEVTMNSPDAAKMISFIANKYPDLNIGAGTVTNMDDQKRAIGAGAQFIVMPIIDESVISSCVQNNIPVFPGAFTPTEIYRAWHLGASAVKVFPASQLGVTYIKEVLAPLNDIKLLPTGGVSADNIGGYFRAGAVGVGMGGSLFNKKLIEQKDWKALQISFDEIKRNIPIKADLRRL